MMRIRNVFLLSIALGSAVGVVAALLFAVQQWSALHDAREAEDDTHLLVAALRLPETMNMERAFINPRLVAAAAATPEQWAPVLHQDELADTAILQARRLAVSPADTGALQAIKDKLLDIRRGALAAIALPRTERSWATVTDYLPQMFAVQEAAYDFALTIQLRINANNHDLGQATRLAILAWDLRDWSGRQTTTLIGYIGQHLPMAGEQAEKWPSTRVASIRSGGPWIPPPQRSAARMY
jgi:hypothetical protein